MRITVSPVGFNAWPELLRLLRESFEYMNGRVDPPSSLWQMGVEEFKNKAAEQVLIVAHEGEHLIGCAFADLQGEGVYIGKVAVAPTARGTCVARGLLAAAEELALRHGKPFLELQTRIELTENHTTFAALGFSKVAETAHPGYNSLDP